MTVETQVSKVTALGNGVATEFSFSPMVLPESADDLEVTLFDADGVETVLTRGTGTNNYSVAVASYPGTGSITYPASGTGKLANDGSGLVMKRKLVIKQSTDLENQGGYYADTQEAALDRIAMVQLQQQEELDRAVKVAISSGVDPEDYLSEAAASVTSAANHKTTASRWATKTDGTVVDAETAVDSGEFSAKAYAVGGATKPTAGSAKDWATKTDGEVVAGQGYGAKKYANDAAASATAAGGSATDAATSASQAAAAAASIGFNDVVFITAAQSPVTITAASAGKLYSVDTSGGNVVFNLPQISTLVLPFTVGVQKTTADANTVTINTDVADDFVGGATSKELASQYGTTLIPDVDPAPDAWTAADWAGAGIADGSITTQKLADGAVTQAKIDPAVIFVPTGALLPFAGASAPSGFLLCDGSAISRTTYSGLFTAIGTAHGAGDGTTTFNVPDLRGRAIAGKDNMGGTAANRLTSGGSGIPGTTLGATGGAETHALTAAENATHNHGVTDPGHVHVIGSSTSAADSSVPTLGGSTASSNYNTNNATTGITIQNSGSGTAHNNVQPTIVLNYIIKT